MIESKFYFSRVSAIGALLLSSLGARADDVGISAFNSTSSSIWGYVPTVQLLIYALAGIIAIVAAIGIYIKMNNEEGNTKKAIISAVGSCVFLLAAATGLPKFFGYDGQTAIAKQGSFEGFADWTAVTKDGTKLFDWNEVSDEISWAQNDPYLDGSKWKPGFNGSIL
ncbi:MAG: DUF4134 family protein [Prevotellaceae bacterium]|nr:DUF4134 family protein [Prevotellaceae bacterium]